MSENISLHRWELEQRASMACPVTPVLSSEPRTYGERIGVGLTILGSLMTFTTRQNLRFLLV